MIKINLWDFLSVIINIAGIYLAFNALFQSRTPQGATAWFLGLIGFPYFAIPLYIAFGRRRYSDDLSKKKCKLSKNYKNNVFDKKSNVFEFEKFLHHLEVGFSGDNEIHLLVDGGCIYSSMLTEIQNAKEYIILQVYIFRTDETGNMFAEALKEKAKEGVKIYILYEKVLINMSEKVLRSMKASGISVGSFRPFKRNKWHLNFRNHRKILIVDGRVGFFGGLNIGDDYVGKYPSIGHWRDTNVKILGSSLEAAQIAFARDWFSSQGEECSIDWKVVPTKSQGNVLVFASGPIDEKPLCLLQHIALVNLATERLWIANPYIVPPQSLMDALAMAALRGVDVRIIVPNKTDNMFIGAVDEIYYERLMEFGIKIFRFNAGFLHQKVILIDNLLGVVGSANFDFRSMYINFEVTTVSSEKQFVINLEKMLENDLLNSNELLLKEIQDRSLIRKIFQRGVNLLAPVL
jgi:cardiolipin synthase